MKNWLFYTLFLATCVATGLYWAWVDHGKPSHESILVMVLVIGLIVSIRAISVGEKPVDIHLSLKKKFNRWKKIWFSK